MSIFNRLSRLFGKQQSQETPDECATTVIKSILQWEGTSSLTMLELPDDPRAVERLLQEWFPPEGETTSEESSRPGGDEHDE